MPRTPRNNNSAQPHIQTNIFPVELSSICIRPSITSIKKTVSASTAPKFAFNDETNPSAAPRLSTSTVIGPGGTAWVTPNKKPAASRSIMAGILMAQMFNNFTIAICVVCNSKANVYYLIIQILYIIEHDFWAYYARTYGR